MGKISKDFIWDILNARLYDLAGERDTLGVSGFKDYMTACEGFVERGEKYDICMDFETWKSIRKMLNDLGIDTPVHIFVQDSVQAVRNAWKMVGGECNED